MAGKVLLRSMYLVHQKQTTRPNTLTSEHNREKQLTDKVKSPSNVKPLTADQRWHPSTPVYQARLSPCNLPHNESKYQRETLGVGPDHTGLPYCYTDV